MKIIVSCDSFKGSCSSVEAVNYIKTGILKVIPDVLIIPIPIADGGEGTVEALVKATEGVYKKATVTDPMGNDIESFFGVINSDTACIEMAAVSGLTLVPTDKRNPMKATTYGTGQLIKEVLDQGFKKILIGIGGSATNDGGMGMAQALGVSFRDIDGNELSFGGGELAKLHEINISLLDKRLKDTEITVICDVSNPLCGDNGASYIYGRQKGADDRQIRILDNNLRIYGDKLYKLTNKDIANIPGSGAAGGLGAGLLAFTGASLKSGIELMLDITGFDKKADNVDLVITGEGKADFQSAFGKVLAGVGRRAKKHSLPVIALVGGIGEGAEKLYECGIDAIFSIADGPMTLEQSMKDVKRLLCDTAQRVMRLFSIRIG